MKKRSLTINSDDSHNKKKMKLNEINFTAEQFTEMISNKLEAFKGMKCFSEMVAQHKNLKEQYNIIQEYILLSPSINDILQHLSVKSISPNISLIYKTLTAILLETTNRKFSSFGINLCKTFLQQHMSVLFTTLSRQNTEITVSALDLLASMVVQGRSIGIKLLKKLATKKIIFSSLLKTDDVPDKVRQGIVRLAVSFFVGNNELLELVLTTDFLQFVLIHLHEDKSAYNIHLMLTTFIQKVLNRSKIKSKSHKSSNFRAISNNKIRQFLSYDGLLTSIGLLFEWNGIMDIPLVEMEDSEGTNVSSIHRLTFQFLYLVCCSTETGIVSPNAYTEDISKLHNDLLLIFLLKLGDHISRTHYAIDLAANIFFRIPSLLVHYFNSSQLKFAPTATLQWFNNCRLITEIYSKMYYPKFLENLDEKHMSKSTFPEMINNILSEILAPVMERSVLTAIILHNDQAIQLQGVRIITGALTNLQSTRAYLKRRKFDNEIYLTIRDAFRKHIPTSNTIMEAWKRMCHSDISTELEVEALKMLSLFLETFLDFFGGKQFDFYDMLVTLTQVATSSKGNQSLLHLLDLLIKCSHHYNWFIFNEKRTALFVILLEFILDIVKISTCTTISDKAFELLIKVCKTNHIVNENEGSSEIHIWIQVLQQFTFKRNNDKEDVRNFFISAAKSVANFSNKHSTKLKKMIQNQTTHKCWSNPAVENGSLKGLSNLQTLKNSSTDFGISLLLVSAFEEISKLTLSKEETNFNLIDRFISHVILKLFHIRLYSLNLKDYITIMAFMFEQTNNQSSFPLLLKLCKDMMAYCIVLENSRDTSPKLETDVFTNVSAFLRIQTQEALSLKDHIPEFHNSQHSRNQVESWIASVVCSLSGFVALMNFRQFNEKLFEETDRAFLLLSEFVKDVRVDLMDNESNKQVQSSHAEQLLAKSSSEVEKKFSFNKNEFILLMHKLLECNIFKEYYIACSSDQRIVKLVNNFVTDALCKVLHLFSTFRWSYHQKILTKALIDIVEFNNDRKNEDIESAALNFFERLHPFFDEKNLIEILNKTTESICSNDVVQFIPHLQRCLYVLERKKFTGFSSVTFKRLFIILIRSPPDRATVPLLSSITSIMLDSPILSLCSQDVEIDLLSWCLNHHTNEDALKLLQALFLCNHPILQLFLGILSSDVNYSLSKQNSSFKKKLAPILSSLITNPNLESHKDDEVSLLNLIKSCYRKKLLKSLFKENGVLQDFEMKMILILIKNNYFHEKDIKKLCAKLPDLLTNEGQFEARWRVSSTLMATLPDQNGFCVQLTHSLMLLSCDLMKTDKTLINSVLNAILELLFKLHKYEALFLSENVDKKLWMKFVKMALKYHFNTVVVLKIIFGLVKLSKHCKSFVELVNVEELHAMITNHSKFLQLMFDSNSKKSNLKLSLLQLLYDVLLDCDESCLHARHFAYLLPSYDGTLSKADQLVYKILRLYDIKGMSNKSGKYIWGQQAMDYFTTLDETDVDTQLNTIFDCLDKDIMKVTLENFPIQRQLLLGDQFEATDGFYVGSEVEADENEERFYDPAFILVAASYYLSSVDVDIKRFVKCGLLSFIVQSLSSLCSNVRCAAAHCILVFQDHLQKKSVNNVREKEVLLCIIKIVRNCTKISNDGKSLKRIYSIATLFLSRSLQLLFQVRDSMFVILFEHLFSTRFNANMIPNFNHSFFSHAVDHEMRRNWTLSLIYDGLRCSYDYHISQAHNNLFRLLMTYYGSELCSKNARLVILQIFERACIMRHPAIDLVSKHALLSWLQSILCNSQKDNEFFLNVCLKIQLIVTCLWNTVSSFNQWMSDQSHISFFSAHSLPQILSLCFELVASFLHVVNNHKRDNGLVLTENKINLEEETHHYFYRIIKIISEIFLLHRESRKEYHDGIFLSDYQFTLLKDLVEYFPTESGYIKLKSFDIFLNWQPKVSNLSSVYELSVNNLLWCLNIVEKNFEKISVEQLNNLLEWINSCLARIDMQNDLRRIKPSLIQCYQRYCKGYLDVTSPPTVHCLGQFHAIFDLLRFNGNDTGKPDHRFCNFFFVQASQDQLDENP